MMLITNVSIGEPASKALQGQFYHFEPRIVGEVFALFYSPSFTNRDGTTVAGFAPGYMVGSQSPVGLGGHWAKVRLPDGLEFLFMPKFKPDHRPIVIELISDVFVIFSIRPAP